MDIKIEATIGTCTEFKSEGGKELEVSIVIAPLKVVAKDGKISVTNGCNMFRSCHNEGCWYSIAARNGRQNAVA